MPDLTDAELAEIQLWHDDMRQKHDDLDTNCLLMKFIDVDQMLGYVMRLLAELRRLRGMRCETWAAFEARVKPIVLEVLNDLSDELPETIAGVIADVVASLVDDIWGLEPDEGSKP